MFGQNCDICAVCNVKGYLWVHGGMKGYLWVHGGCLWVQGGYLSVLGGYLGG